MDAVELTRRLVRMRTVGPGNHAAACQEHLGGLLAAHGFSLDRHVMADGRMNLVARRGAISSDPICFSGHIDTVPLGGAPWDVDPFGADITEGKIHGRGTSDMKAGVAAFVAAACSLSQGELASPLLIILSDGEETGCEGVLALVKERRLGRARLLLVAEPTNNRIAAGHKGAQWLRAKIRGRAAHGSMPELGINAALLAAAKLHALEKLALPDPCHPLGRPTINVGTVRAGTYVNAVPDLAEIGLDLRSVPGGSALDAVLCLLGGDVETELTLDLAPVWTDPNDVMLEQMSEIAAATTGQSPEKVAGVSYFTDASVLKPALGNPPTVICGPGDPAQAHRTNEHVAVSAVEKAFQFYRAVMLRPPAA